MLFWQSSYCQKKEEGDKGAPSQSDSWLEQQEPLEMGVDVETRVSETEQPFSYKRVSGKHTSGKKVFSKHVAQ